MAVVYFDRGRWVATVHPATVLAPGVTAGSVQLWPILVRVVV